MSTDSNKLPHYISFVVTCLKDIGHLINTEYFASQSTLIIHNNFAYFFFSPGATTTIGGCILQPSSGL